MGLPGKLRKDICLLGPAPTALKSALEHRELQHFETTPEEAVARCRGAARAIISISNPLDLNSHLNAVLRPALENGVAFLAVEIEKDEFARASRMCGSEELMRRLGILPQDAQDAQLLPVRAFGFETTPGWEQKIAHYCANHDPGRSSDENCKIDISSLPTDKNLPDEEDVRLAQRAFNECSLATLKHLSKGHSRAKGPWIVEAQFKDGRRPVNFVLKTGPIAEIKKEIDVMQVECFNHIPFRHYPPVVLDRCLIGATKRAIVSMLVEKAITYEQYIRDANQGNKIAEIFEGPLKLWRKVQETREVNFGELYKARGVAPKEAWHMKDIWKASKESDPDILQYKVLYDRFFAHPNVEAKYVHGHGDFHLRNILIHGSGDVLLIDFSDSDRLPASYDPATLDVALAFDVPAQSAAEAGVSDAQRLDFYSPPLLQERAVADCLYRLRCSAPGIFLPLLNFCPSHRIGAILALRKHIRSSISEVEYQLAIVGRLMWWARWRKSPIAYRCASRILESIGPGA